MNIKRLTYATVAGVAALLTVTVYLPALWNGFVNWDDNAYVYDNLHIRNLDWSFVQWAFSSFHAGNWHPLTWLSHGLDYALWGLDPVGHHLTNILLHAVNTGLVVLLCIKLAEIWKKQKATDGTSSFVDGWGILILSGVTGLLFGLHPLHVESVAWVAERKDLLCGLFFLLSISAYADHVRLLGSGTVQAERAGSIFLDKSYLFSLTFFALALLSKPMAVSLPVVLLLLDWHPFGRISSRRSFVDAIAGKLPFIGLGLISAGVTVLAQRTAMWTIAPPLSVRVLVAAKSLIAYMVKMVVPMNLMPLYPYSKDISQYLSFEYGIAAVLVIGITVISIRSIRKEKLWLALWCYYVATLFPVIGIIQVGSQSMADRYTYLPSLGPFLLAGVGTAWVWAKADTLKKWGLTVKRLGALVVLLVVIALSYATVQQIAIWKNSIDLWSYVIGKEPNRVPVAYYNRGLAFKEAGKPGPALSDFTSAITLRPSYPEAFINRGVIYRELGRLDQAIEDFNAAIILKPALYSVYMNRALALKEIGWLDQAIEDYNTAIALNPFHADAFVERGQLSEDMGRFDRALGDFNMAISLDSDLVKAFIERGDLYRKMGEADLAVADYQTACNRGNKDGCEALRRYRKQ